jgi:DNA-binding protein HU-beta
MTKQDLVAQVAKNANLSMRAAKTAVDSVFSSVANSLKKGEKVVVTGFGTFLVRKRAARKGRNPQTGAEIQIPASKTPGFTAGKSLKRLVK